MIFNDIGFPLEFVTLVDRWRCAASCGSQARITLQVCKSMAMGLMMRLSQFAWAICNNRSNCSSLAPALPESISTEIFPQTQYSLSERFDRRILQHLMHWNKVRSYTGGAASATWFRSTMTNVFFDIIYFSSGRQRFGISTSSPASKCD